MKSVSTPKEMEHIINVYDRIMISEIRRKLEEHLSFDDVNIDVEKLAEDIYYGNIPLTEDEVIRLIKEDIIQLRELREIDMRD